MLTEYYRGKMTYSVYGASDGIKLKIQANDNPNAVVLLTIEDSENAIIVGKNLLKLARQRKRRAWFENITRRRCSFN